MARVFLGLLCVFALNTLVSEPVLALDPTASDRDGIVRGFTFKNKDFKGWWKIQQSWKDPFCKGTASFQANLKGSLSNFDLIPESEGSMFAVATLENIRISLVGRMKSSMSFCRKVAGSYPVTVDRIDVESKVFFKEIPGQDTPDIRLRIESTKFTGVTLVRGLPEYLEQYLARAVNSGFNELWTTKLGDYLAAKLVELAKKNLPKP